MFVVAMVVFAIGSLITLFNAYLAFLRPVIHRIRGGGRDTYKWASGIPLLGSMLLWASIPMLPTPIFRWIAAGLSLFDVGGIHWFVVNMIATGQWREFVRGSK